MTMRCICQRTVGLYAADAREMIKREYGASLFGIGDAYLVDVVGLWRYVTWIEEGVGKEGDSIDV